MPKGKQIQPDSKCKASPEQREKWRQYKAKAREKRAAGSPARQYHKKEVQKMTTISECCETKQPELISTLVEDAVKQAAIPPESTKCIQNEYIVPSESVADLEAYPLVDWRKAKDYTDYRKMLEAANKRITMLCAKYTSSMQISESAFKQSNELRRKYAGVVAEYEAVLKFLQDSLKQMYTGMSYALEVVQNKAHDQL